MQNTGSIEQKVWLKGVNTLLELLDDDLVLARAIRERDYERLAAAVLVARSEVDPQLAMSDPALFVRLREAITLFFLKGYRCIDPEKLARLARDQD